MRIILSCLALLLTHGVLCQNVSEKPRAVFFELAGSGGIASFNYEKAFAGSENAMFTWRAGFSIAPIDRNNGTGLVFPLMVNALLGNGDHRLEVGLGQGLTLTTRGSVFALTTATLGYRYQGEGKRFFYRASYTPLISYIVDFQVQHWAGISVGYSLN